jgi:hypothetical protein
MEYKDGFLTRANQLVFAMETQCVFCDVGNELFGVLYMNFLLQRTELIQHPHLLCRGNSRMRSYTLPLKAGDIREGIFKKYTQYFHLWRWCEKLAWHEKSHGDPPVVLRVAGNFLGIITFTGIPTVVT